MLPKSYAIGLTCFFLAAMQVNTLSTFGDIALNDEQLKYLRDLPHRSRQKRNVLNFDNFPIHKWNMPIKYVINSSFTETEAAIIDASMGEWMKQTCVVFEKHNVTDSITDQHIAFQPSSEGCWTYAGYTTSPRPFPINLQSIVCFIVWGSVMHEIGHSLGLLHEHNRPDRDDYITILWENIDPDNYDQFNKTGWTTAQTYNISYDVGSVMHYKSTHYQRAADLNTIIPREATLISATGQRSELSFYDAQAINTAYCNGVCRQKLACQNGGYTDPKNCSTCRCPQGWAGTLCDLIEHGALGCSPMSGLIVVPPSSNFSCLVSPQFSSGASYTPGDTCTWMLQVGVGCELQLWFSAMMGVLRTVEGTCLHWVEIYYKTSHITHGQRFCGYESPSATLIAERNDVLIHFRAPLLYSVLSVNASVDFRGFSLCYIVGSCLASLRGNSSASGNMSVGNTNMSVSNVNMSVTTNTNMSVSNVNMSVTNDPAQSFTVSQTRLTPVVNSNLSLTRSTTQSVLHDNNSSASTNDPALLLPLSQANQTIAETNHISSPQTHSNTTTQSASLDNQPSNQTAITTMPTPENNNVSESTTSKSAQETQVNLTTSSLTLDSQWTSVSNSNNSLRTRATRFPHSKIPRQFLLSAKIGAFEWSDELSDVNSPAYASYATTLCKEMNTIFGKGVSHGQYLKCTCESFRQGSVYATVGLTFNVSQSIWPSKPVMLTRKISDVLVKKLTANNTLDIDAHSLKIRTFEFGVNDPCLHRSCDQICIAVEADSSHCECFTGNHGNIVNGTFHCTAEASRVSFELLVGVTVGTVLTLGVAVALFGTLSLRAERSRRYKLRLQHYCDSPTSDFYVQPNWLWTWWQNKARADSAKAMTAAETSTAPSSDADSQRPSIQTDAL